METWLLWLHRLFQINPWALGFFLIGIAGGLTARRRLDAVLLNGAGVASRLWTTGAEAAEEILHATSLENVEIEPVRGTFTDFYDRQGRTIRLSEAVFEGHSLTMLALASFETGHALQDARRDPPLPLWVRDGSAQFVRLAPRWLIGTALLGFFLENPTLMHGALVGFPIAVALPLVALPIEWDAGRRARRALAMTALVDSNQGNQLERILNTLAWRLIDPALPRWREPAWPLVEPDPGFGPDPSTGPRPSQAGHTPDDQRSEAL